MSLQSIIAALIGLMQTAPGLGHLYPYQRVLIAPEDVQAVFGIEDPTSTRGWSVRYWQLFRSGVNEERLDLSGEHTRVTHHLNLSGIREHNDAYQSEVAFCAVVDALRALLRNGLAIAPEARLTLMPQVPEEGLIILGDTYTCHHARITLDAQEMIDANEQDDWLMLLPNEQSSVPAGAYDFV